MLEIPFRIPAWHPRADIHPSSSDLDLALKAELFIASFFLYSQCAPAYRQEGSMHEGAAMPPSTTMTGRAPNLYDNALGGEASREMSSESLGNAQAKGHYHASSTSLCKKCSTLTYQRMRISETSQEGQLHHENWTSLVKAAKLGCQLCIFFTVAALHPKSRPGKAFYADENGPIRLRIVETWKAKVLCLHMFVPQDRHPAVYYLYLTTETPSPIPHCDIKMTDSERDRLSYAAISKITSWIQECQTQHLSCRRQPDSSLPTRVIDISLIESHGCVHLVEGNECSRAEYVALSHCWGSVPPNSINLVFKCDSGNIATLRHGIHVESLPRLYQDAIHVTKALGKRYIWIDSLCIIQDSKDDWARECGRMSDVYSQSYITISAMSYENNLKGFQKVRDEDIPPHCALCPLPEHPGTHVNIRSIVEHDSRIDYLKTRGWAFQELLLSPRVLHFTTTAMAFECDTCTVMERGPGGDSLFGFDPGRKRLVYAADSLHMKYYDRWLQVVQSYSHLKLTFDSDRLPALSGIASLVASKTNDHYVAGIWRKDIVAGLLWYVWPCQPIGSTYIAPSWSWASPPSVWTFDPARRRFLKLDLVDVYAKLATSNPYGEISAARLTISGPLKECATSQLTKKGQRFYVLRGDRSFAVRFSFDVGKVESRNAGSIWCLDCTTDKEEDLEMARLSKRRETFFRPHGLVLERVREDEPLHKRIGAFEVFDISGEDTDWHKTGFQFTTITLI